MHKCGRGQIYMNEIKLLHAADLHLDSPFEGLGGEKAMRRRAEQRQLLYGIAQLAERYKNNPSLFFIGRNVDYAVCMEGSLKLKEISYLHSEAYAAGELKHGTIALIEENRLVIAVACYEPLFDKTMSNVKEVKARGARVLGVALEGNRAIYSEADDVILVPRMDDLFVVPAEIVPLQLFAYYVAKANGCAIDKPKNLAKSVTVE